MIRHIVAVRFPEGQNAAVRDGLWADLGGLRDVIPGILDYRTFVNVSPETAVVRGFRDLFWFDFSDAAARDLYLDHPAHRAIGARLVAAAEGGIAGIAVIDVAL